MTDTEPGGEFVAGYVFEFFDQGPVETAVVRRGTEDEIRRTATALELLGDMPQDSYRSAGIYTGDRVISSAVVFTCRTDALDER